jgi:hypothetical protein
MTLPTIEVTDIVRAPGQAVSGALQGRPQLSAAEGISGCVATRNWTRKRLLKFHLYLFIGTATLLIETDSTDALAHSAVSCSSRFRCRLARIRPNLDFWFQMSPLAATVRIGDVLPTILPQRLSSLIPACQGRFSVFSCFWPPRLALLINSSQRNLF